MKITHCDWCGVGEGFHGAKIDCVLSKHMEFTQGVGSYYPVAYDLCTNCNKLLQALISESKALGVREGWLPAPKIEVKKPRRWVCGRNW